MKKHKILFIHGFGVMKDSRGIFSDISEFIGKNKNTECILFDLNDKNNSGGIRVQAFSTQIDKIKSVYEKHKDAETIDVICHSQGCLVGAMANLKKVRKTIFLAPPVENNIEKTINYFSQNPLSKIDLDGESFLERRDGTQTVVPKTFWEEKKSLDFKSIYKSYAQEKKVVVVKAVLDDVSSNSGFEDTFLNIKTYKLETNHNFDNMREEVMEIIERELF